MEEQKEKQREKSKGGRRPSTWLELVGKKSKLTTSGEPEHDNDDVFGTSSGTGIGEIGFTGPFYDKNMVVRRSSDKYMTLKTANNTTGENFSYIELSKCNWVNFRAGIVLRGTIGLKIAHKCSPTSDERNKCLKS